MRAKFEHRVLTYKRGLVAQLEIRAPADFEGANRRIWPFANRG
jgi:hypothetical protein